jgi:hypothetical protein
MTELYPAGSTIPIQPWFIESMQRQLVHEKEGARRYGEFQQYLVQRFGAWRVFPVKAGRWVREPFWHELTDDLPSLLLAPVLLPLRSARWKAVNERLQLLDPSSGMPIAEHTVGRLGLGSDGERAQWRQTRQLALLGDPRVGGLIAPLNADSLGQLRTISRSGYYLRENTAEFEQKAAQLVNLPYRDFTERNDGPWAADHPEKPKGHTNGWKPSPWYRPA